MPGGLISVEQDGVGAGAADVLVDPALACSLLPRLRSFCRLLFAWAGCRWHQIALAAHREPALGCAADVAAMRAKSAPRTTERCPSSRGGSLPLDYSRERGKGVYVWRLVSLTLFYSTFLPSHLLFLCLCCFHCCFCLFIAALVFSFYI